MSDLDPCDTTRPSSLCSRPSCRAAGLKPEATRPRRPWGWYALVGVLGALAGHTASVAPGIIPKLLVFLSGAWALFGTLMAARPAGRWRIRGKAPALGRLGAPPDCTCCGYLGDMTCVIHDCVRHGTYYEQRDAHARGSR